MFCARRIPAVPTLELGYICIQAAYAPDDILFRDTNYASAVKEVILESLRMMQTGTGTADADAGGTTRWMTTMMPNQTRILSTRCP
jgi:hypothetical protein